MEDKIKQDDELVCELINNDKIIEQDNVYSILEQNENLIAFKIEGVYKDVDKRVYNSKKHLSTNPPKLVINDSNENEVTFLLTKDFTNNLMESLEEVNRAYLGYATSKKKEPFSLQRLFKEEPLKAILLILMCGGIGIFFITKLIKLL